MFLWFFQESFCSNDNEKTRLRFNHFIHILPYVIQFNSAFRKIYKNFVFSSRNFKTNPPILSKRWKHYSTSIKNEIILLFGSYLSIGFSIHPLYFKLLSKLSSKFTDPVWEKRTPLCSVKFKTFLLLSDYLSEGFTIVLGIRSPQSSLHYQTSDTNSFMNENVLSYQLAVFEPVEIEASFFKRNVWKQIQM